MMIDIKKQVFDALRANLPGVAVQQEEQAVFANLPAVTFSLANNTHQITVDFEIGQRDIEIKLDVWTKTTKAGSELLAKVEQILRAQGWQLSYTADVPNPADEGVKHITTRFRAVL